MKAGQQFICTNKAGWVDTENGLPTDGPKFNEQVTFLRTESQDPDFLVFAEYEFCTDGISEDGYHKMFFEPLITDAQLQKEFETIEQFA